QTLVHDAQVIVLIEKRLLICCTNLDVVKAFDIGERSSQPGVCQRSILRNRLLLNRREIIKEIWTWIVVVVISADEPTQREHRVIAQQSSPRRRDVERLDLGPLICCAKRIACGIGLPKMKFIIKAVRVLEPRARER